MSSQIHNQVQVKGTCSNVEEGSCTPPIPPPPPPSDHLMHITFPFLQTHKWQPHCISGSCKWFTLWTLCMIYYRTTEGSLAIILAIETVTLKLVFVYIYLKSGQTNGNATVICVHALTLNWRCMANISRNISSYTILFSILYLKTHF